MFTGIVEEVGTIKAIKDGANSAVLTISGDVIFSDLHLGDSVAVNGICLTVTVIEKNTFNADVMHETLNRTSLSKIKSGSIVNLERAMAANGRFGGHIVSGHIDGTGIISNIQKDDNAIWYTITADENILKYIVKKGSIAIDGISLTIAKVSKASFSVSVIPHTTKSTILSQNKIGDIVNLENDIVGKYIEKLNFHHNKSEEKQNIITKEFLIRNGY